MLWESRIGGPCARSVCSAPFVSTNDTTAELTRRMGLSPQKYYFNATINATTSISKFWFELDEHNGKGPVVLNNGGSGYVIEQDHVLFDPARSTANEFSGGFDIVVAVGVLLEVSTLDR